MSAPVGVMHVVDRLFAGGAERIAVELSNRLPRDRYRAYLCTTRADGALEHAVRQDVGRLRLARRSRLDIAAVARLAGFVEREDISILHAHGPALLVATLAGMLRRGTRIVWHVHIGRYAARNEAAGAYGILTRRVAAVLAVSEPLVDWCRRRLPVDRDRIHYLRNAVAPGSDGAAAALPGVKGARIVCVGNYRPEKDQLTLVRAMTGVMSRCPDAHLLLVGEAIDASYEARVRAEIAAAGLGGRISMLGSRADVGAILRACDIGVLSSASEGLPLALAEYGTAGLAAVATDVGQCSEVLDGGEAGVLVPPGDPARLADALVALLADPARRREIGRRFQRHAEAVYGFPAMIERLDAIYRGVLSETSRAGVAPTALRWRTSPQ